MKQDFASASRTLLSTSSFGVGNSTASVHLGEERFNNDFSLTQPVLPSATFVFKDTADLCRYNDATINGEKTGRHEYGRYSNPTVDACERRYAALEGAEAAALFPSGMAAISTTLLSLLNPGAHIIIGSDCYRRTRQLCFETLARFGFTTSVVEMGDYEALEKAITPRTEVIMFETPTNPYLRIVDLERLVEIARRTKVKTFIDATFATPLNIRPLEFGIDLVTHAATKYLSGHNNLLAGVVAGSGELISKIRSQRGILGSMPDPLVASRLIDQVKTLGLRIARQNESGQRVAEFLSNHPLVERVWYPGLSSHPEHEIAKRQMAGFGGVVSFEVNGSLEDTAAFVDALKIPRIAPSLGGVDALVEQPALMSFYELTTDQRLKLGMKDNLVRFALGIEEPEDIIGDIEAAFGEIERRRAATTFSKVA